MASLEIEGRSIGRLIGTRGATIKKLQSDFNVNISISKEDNEVNLFCFAIPRNISSKNILRMAIEWSK